MFYYQLEGGSLKWDGNALNYKDAIKKALGEVSECRLGLLIRFRSNRKGEKKWQYLSSEKAIDIANNVIKQNNPPQNWR